MKELKCLARHTFRLVGPLGAKSFLPLLACCLFWVAPAFSQQVAWPVGVLRPPGTDYAAPVLSAVALSGDLAVTGYAGTATEGFRVFSRAKSASTWTFPQLLVQGQGPADGAVSLSADPQRLAIGSPLLAGVGKVMIYARNAGPTGWVLEQTIDAPAGAVQFGKTLSLRGNLLVVTATQDNGAVYSYRYDADLGSWTEAGFTFVNSFLGTVSAVTDGERIAYCRPLMVTGCITEIHVEGSGWQVEAFPQPVVPGGRVLGVSSDWLFIRRNENIEVYAHVESDWQFRQLIPNDKGFSMSADGSSIVVSQLFTSQILSVGSGGLWEVVSDVSLASDIAAIDDHLALIGAQGLADDGVAWSASGDAAGVFDVSESLFGESLAQVGNELWIGAPGYDANDQSAGSVWIFPSLGAASHPEVPSLAPAQPALQSFFGAGIVSDGVRAATFSYGESGAISGRGRVWVFDAVSHQELQQIDLPVPAGTVDGLNLSISGNVLAASRKIACPGVCESDVLIYRDDGSGYALSQTITAPVGAPASAYFARSALVDGDWLLSGMLVFRSVAGGDFEYAGELARPQGLSWSLNGIASDGNRLIAAVAPNASSILFVVYDFDGATGWTFAGTVSSGAITVQNGCRRFAIRDVQIVCTDASFQSVKLFLAVADVVGNNWTVIGAAPIPEYARDPSGNGSYQLRWVSDKVAIGTANTGEETAGSQIGQVTIMTLDEGIFASGFD